ncbi:MAG: VOC family protein [Hyphomicrobiaceae bacterium]
MFCKEMGNYMLVTTTHTHNNRPTRPGAINGDFFPAKPDWPAQHPLVVIAADGIALAIDAVTAAGGKISGEPMIIPGVGHYVSFLDTEGLDASMMQVSGRCCEQAS